MKTISENVIAEYIEKKSKFIASVYYIASEKDAKEIIQSVSQKYSDATHNVYAYSVLDNGVLKSKFSDAGEPKHTAGKPVLELLNKQQLVNVLVIVSRYFGGIKLGVSGLGRAYTKSAASAIEEAKVIDIVKTEDVLMELDYQLIKILQNIISKYAHCKINKKDFNEKIIFDVTVTDECLSELRKIHGLSIKR